MASIVVGHISATGGNAPGLDHCRSAALGRTELPFGGWHAVELWWDGSTVGAVARQRPPMGIGNFFFGDLRRLTLWA